MSHRAIRGKQLSRRGWGDTCRGPGVGLCLTHLGNSEEPSVGQRASERGVGGEVMELGERGKKITQGLLGDSEDFSFYTEGARSYGGL